MTILVLAPHADDEVLGMGGAIARFIQEGKRVVIAVLTGHGETPHPLWPESSWDVIRKECRIAASILGVSAEDVLFRELPAACLDTVPAWKINAVIGELVKDIQPEEVYVPFHFDLHGDHAASAYGLYVAARPYLQQARCIRRVLAYETPSETHLAPPYLFPGFQPNVYISVAETLGLKLQAMRAYHSQLQPDGLPRSISSLKAIATLRGAHIGSEAAEGFVLLGEYIR